MLGLLVALFAMAASAQNVGVSIALPMANSFPPAYCPRVCLNVTAQQWSRTGGGGQGPEFEKFAKLTIPPVQTCDGSTYSAWFTFYSNENTDFPGCGNVTITGWTTSDGDIGNHPSFYTSTSSSNGGFVIFDPLFSGGCEGAESLDKPTVIMISPLENGSCDTDAVTAVKKAKKE